MARKHRKIAAIFLLLAAAAGCGKLRGAISDLEAAKKFAEESARDSQTGEPSPELVAAQCASLPEVPPVTVADTRKLKTALPKLSPLINPSKMPAAHSSAFLAALRDLRAKLQAPASAMKSFRELLQKPEDEALSGALDKFGVAEGSTCGSTFLIAYAYHYIVALDPGAELSVGGKRIGAEKAPGASIALTTGLGEDMRVLLFQLESWTDSDLDAFTKETAELDRALADAPRAAILDLRGARGASERALEAGRAIVQRLLAVPLVLWVDGATSGDAEVLALELSARERVKVAGDSAKTAGYARRACPFSERVGGAAVELTLGCEALKTSDGRSPDSHGVPVTEHLATSTDASSLAAEAETMSASSSACREGIQCAQ